MLAVEFCKEGLMQKIKKGEPGEGDPTSAREDARRKCKPTHLYESERKEEGKIGSAEMFCNRRALGKHDVTETFPPPRFHKEG